MIIVALIILLIDQLSKYAIVASGSYYTLNSGIAFSLPLTNTVALITSCVLICFLAYFHEKLLPNNHQKLATYAIGSVIGGATSNVIDRIHLPGVIDFIKLPYWPTFNLADSAICIGIIILMVLHWKNKENYKL